MSEHRNAQIRLIENGFVLSYWAHVGRQMTQVERHAASLPELIRLIADRYGIPYSPTVPDHPLSPLAERAIAAAENEDDAVGEPVVYVNQRDEE